MIARELEDSFDKIIEDYKRRLLNNPRFQADQMPLFVGKETSAKFGTKVLRGRISEFVHNNHT